MTSPNCSSRRFRPPDEPTGWKPSSHERAPEALLGTVVGKRVEPGSSPHGFSLNVDPTCVLDRGFMPFHGCAADRSPYRPACSRAVVALTIGSSVATVLRLSVPPPTDSWPTTRRTDLRLEPGREQCAATDRRGRPRVQSHLVSGWDPISVLGRREPGLVVHRRGRWQQRPKLTSRIWISTDKPPTWSPDSRFIAFSAREWTRQGRRATLRGRDRNRRRHTARTRWTDRCSVVLPIVVARRQLDRFHRRSACQCQRYGHGVVGRPAKRPRTTRLPTSPAVELAQPQWAPSADPLRLAYAAQNAIGSDRDVYILDVATGVETPIASGPDDNRAPTWSPDGTRLAWLVIGSPAPLESLRSPRRG